MTKFTGSPRTASFLLLLLLAGVWSLHPISAAEPAPSARGSAPISMQALHSKVDPLVNGSLARNAETSIRIVDVETGQVVAERNPHQPLAPASNMKLFTTAAGLELLEQPYEFTTTVSMLGDVDSSGVLHGDVKITGGGDPTIGTRFHDGRATAVVEEWVSELKRLGIQTIDGNLIFEYGFFDDTWVHPSWPKDQLVHWYEAPVSALSMQEGCVQVRVTPGQPGKPAVVEMIPPNRFITIENTCVTSPRGRGVFIGRKPGTNTILVHGNVSPRAGATEINVTVMHPVRYFANVVHDTFTRTGIRLTGQPLVTRKDPRNGWKTVTRHRTPLPVVIYVINKKSQNYYAEQLLKTIGAERKGVGSWETGTSTVEGWIHGELGVAPAEFDQVDGSGMSRENRASSAAFIELLRHMWKSPHRFDFVSSMPYSGEMDSRLRRRLNRQPYARNIYAKTGYISGVIGLSGYVHGESGRVYAFSMLFNHYRTGVLGVYKLQDDILQALVRNG